MRIFRCAMAVAAMLVIGLPVAAQEVGDHARTLKGSEYGEYWNRLKAAQKLSKMNSLEAAKALTEGLAHEDLAVQESCAIALSRFDDFEAMEWLAGTYLVKAKEREARANAAWALELRRKDDIAAQLLLALKREKAPEVAAAIIRALGAMRAADAVEPLKGFLRARDEVRAAAAWALGELGATDALEELKKAAASRGREWRGRCAAYEALARLQAEDVTAILNKALQSRFVQDRIAAVDAYRLLGADTAFVPVVSAIDDAEWSVRVAVIEALVDIWEKRCIQPLVDRLFKEEGRLRLDISIALQKMTGKEIGFSAESWSGWWEANKDSFVMPPRPGDKDGKKDFTGDGVTATFFGIPILSDRVAFVIDYSGSMIKGMEDPRKEGVQMTKLEMALDEFRKALDHFLPRQRFMLIVSSTEAVAQNIRKPDDQLAPASRKAIKKVLEFGNEAKERLSQIKRGRGDMWEGIIEAFALPEVDTVIVLSDGVPTYGRHQASGSSPARGGAQFLKGMRDENRFRRSAIHTILIGSKGTDRKFMEQLARENNGLNTTRTAPDEE